MNKLGIELTEILILETISIWWICNNSSTRLIGINEVLTLKVDIFSNSSTECISLGNSNHLWITVGCSDGVLSDEFFFLEIFLDVFILNFIIEGKIHKTKIPRESWCNIACHERGLDRKRSRSTTWIPEWLFVSPATHSNQPSSKGFFDWCISLFCSVSSLMECISCDIKEDSSCIIDNEDEDMKFFYPSLFSCGSSAFEYCFLSDALNRWNTRED